MLVRDCRHGLVYENSTKKKISSSLSAKSVRTLWGGVQKGEGGQEAHRGSPGVGSSLLGAQTGGARQVPRVGAASARWIRREPFRPVLPLGLGLKAVPGWWLSPTG